MRNINKYNEELEYALDSRPTTESVVSFVTDSRQVHYDGKNVVKPLTKYGKYDVGDELCVDTLSNELCVLATKTYDESSFGSRYRRCGVFFCFNDGGVLKFDCGVNVTGMWANYCFYRIEGLDLSRAGSFDYAFDTNIATGKSATGTVSWEAGATLASVVSSWDKPHLYGNIVVTTDGLAIGVSVGGYKGALTLTISNLTGGAESAVLVDLSKNYTIDGVETITEEHHPWQIKSLKDIFSEDKITIGMTANAYTVSGVNRRNRCGMRFSKFKAYSATNGSDTFVDDTSSGNIFPMKSSVFAQCIDGTVGGDAGIALYKKHNGSYDSYIRAAMVDIDNRRNGVLKYCLGDNGKMATFLASVMTKDYNLNDAPVFPIHYNASYITIDSAIPVKPYLWSVDEGCRVMDDNFIDDYNRILAKRGKTQILESTNFWFASEYHAFYGQLYNGKYGTLNVNDRFYSNSARAFLAFNL